MRRYLGWSVVWLGATALSVLIASTAVAGIRNRVVDTPVALGAPTTTTTVAPATTIPTTLVPASSTSTSTTTTSTTAPETTTTVDSQTTTTAPRETTSTTSTTAAPATTVAPLFDYPVYSLEGGTVTLKVGEGTVQVWSTTQNPGYYVHVEKDGPTEVKVEFESNDHKSVLTAHFENGELKADSSESGDGGDDGGGGGGGDD